MDEQIDLEDVSRDNCTELQTFIFESIKRCLESPDETAAKAARLSSVLRDIGATKASDKDASLFLWELWMIVLDIAWRTPPDHPWQDALVLAILSLRQTGGHLGNPDSGWLDWRDLPHFREYMLDKWLDPTELDDWTPSDASGWKNQNSFAARLSAENSGHWMTFSIYGLQSGLEETPPKGPVLKCRVWVATEWILRLGKKLFEYAAEQDVVIDEAAAKASESGVPPEKHKYLGIWKGRIQELLDQKEDLELSTELVDRLTKAREKISEYENSTKEKK